MWIRLPVARLFCGLVSEQLRVSPCKGESVSNRIADCTAHLVPNNRLKPPREDARALVRALGSQHSGRGIMTTARQAPDDYRYDVCLSFAGEDRDYVNKVAEELRSAGVRVFYDLYEQVDLWGKGPLCSSE